MEVSVCSMKVKVSVRERDPHTRLSIGHDLSGDYMIEVSDALDPDAACETALAACCEQLSLEADHSFELTAQPVGAPS